MKIFRTIWFYVILAVIVVTIAIGGSFIVTTETNKLEVNVNEDILKTGCVSVNVTPIEGATDYSFDGGKTWQKSNYGVFYENGTYEIIARDEDGKVLSKQEYKVDSIQKGIPKIDLDFDKEIESTDEKELLDGVSAINNYFDITDKLEVEVVSEEEDYAIVKYSVENNSGKHSTVIAKLHKKINKDFSFQLDNYNCIAGKTIQTFIKVKNANVMSYVSEDETIAKVENSNTKIEKCENCIAINIKCLKPGATKITAFDENNNKKEANVIVSDATGAILFDKKEYSCTVGDTIKAQITATSQSNALIKSVTSNNVKIASLEKENNSNCNNCTFIKIKCNKVGSTVISATSSTGAIGQAAVKVNEKNVGTISFDKNVYRCDEGKTIEVTITASGDNIKVSSYTSSNNEVATIVKHPTKTLKCMNCLLAQLKCIKAGTVTLSAKSSTGATTKSTVNVVKENNPDTNIGKVTFDKTNFSCNTGEKFATLITGTDPIKEYKSADTSIATIARKTDGLQPNCSNCAYVEVTCKKKGTTTLTASTMKGATTSSKVTVNEQNAGKVTFDKTSFSCNTGEKFATLITGTDPIKEYKSADTSIATIARKTDGLQPNCSNCAYVEVTCKKKGTTTLTASTMKGATANAKVSVNEQNLGTINFEKTSYSCSVGDKFSMLITSSSPIKEYKSGDTTIATIAKKTDGLQPNCSNCAYVEVTCKKEGTTTLTASSMTGATANAKLTVDTKGGISFVDSSYSCNAGKKIKAYVITPYSMIKSVDIKDSTSGDLASVSIGEVVDNSLAGKKYEININCLNEGRTELVATANNGKTATVPLTIARPTVFFDEKSYSCKAGQTFNVGIHFDPSLSLSGKGSNDINIATISNSTAQPNCIGCRNYTVTCVKVGITKIYVKGSDGYKATATIFVTK